MPYYSDLGLYSGPSTSSYVPLYLSGPYSNHSSILANNFNRIPPTYIKSPRGFRSYKPHLTTISERRTDSPLRNLTTKSKVTYTPVIIPRPIKINTADIDVSVNKYRKYDRQRNNPEHVTETKHHVSKSPSPSRSSESPRSSTELKDATPNMIKRERATVRIKTIHKDRVLNPTSYKKWRDNFEPEELYPEEIESPKTKKSPGEILREKFLIPNETLNVDKELVRSPSFHEICTAITSASIDEELNPGQPVEVQRRQSRQFSAEDILKEIRRTSVDASDSEKKAIDTLLAKVENEKTDEKNAKKKRKYSKTNSTTKLTLDSTEDLKDQPLMQRRLTLKKRGKSTGLEEILPKNEENTNPNKNSIITATVNVEEKSYLKAVIDDISIVESPTIKTKNRIFNFTVEEIEETKCSNSTDPTFVTNGKQEEGNTDEKVKDSPIITPKTLENKEEKKKIKTVSVEKKIKQTDLKEKESVGKSLPEIHRQENEDIPVEVSKNVKNVAEIEKNEVKSEIVEKRIKQTEVKEKSNSKVNPQKSESVTVEVPKKLPNFAKTTLSSENKEEKEKLTNMLLEKKTKQTEVKVRESVKKRVPEVHPHEIESTPIEVPKNFPNIAQKTLSKESNKEKDEVKNVEEKIKQRESVKKKVPKVKPQESKSIIVEVPKKKKPVISKIVKKKNTARLGLVLEEINEERSSSQDKSKNHKDEETKTAEPDTKNNHIQKSESSEDFWKSIGMRETLRRREKLKRPESKQIEETIEIQEEITIEEEMTSEMKKLLSKRSLVQKAKKEDPDLVVFEPPPTSEPPTETPEEKDTFVPLQSNRLSQWMNPFKKPEQFDECPVEIYARPKTIRKRHVPKGRHGQWERRYRKENSDSSDSDGDTTSSSGSSSSSSGGIGHKDGVRGFGAIYGASTSSNDSGFDSGAAKKMDEGLVAENRDSPSSSLATNPAFAIDPNEEECYKSSTYQGFQKSGRITPPATTIPRFRKYNVDDFHFLKVLGKGSFGKVLLAELKDTEFYYAIKCLKKDVVLEDDDVECTLIERKVLALGTKHPYLCHLLCTFQTESHLFFVMEYLNGGDLMFHIQQTGRFSEDRSRFYGAEIVSGLKFLHNKGIVYRDLKLDNILLDFDGHVRIADFGMCKLQIFLDRMADTFCGTPDYMAPEIIKGQHYNQSVDWWSFGVLLYEMLLGQSPFSGCDEDELFWSICNEKPVLPRFLSPEASRILSALLEKDASKRLGTRFSPNGDIKDQPFFRTIDWEQLEARLLEPPFKPNLSHPLDTKYFDKHFTLEQAKLTPIENRILESIDQTQFQGFSYTNPNATEK